MQAEGRGMGQKKRGRVRARAEGKWGEGEEAGGGGGRLFGMGSARRGTEIITPGIWYVSGLRQEAWTEQ